MLRLVVAYIATAVVFIAMDFGWLSFASNRLYRPALGDLLAAKVNLAPGVLFYLIYMAGVLALATAPALKADSWSKAAVNGAILGLAAYGTYDLTNQATLRTWSTRLTVADMGWGMFATAVAASAGFWVARSLFKTAGA